MKLEDMIQGPSAARGGGVRLLAAVALALSVGVASTGVLAQDHDLTIVLQDEPYTMEPCDANGSIVGKVLKQNVVETLVDKDAVTGALVPRLATSWEKLADNSWRFKLREGVKFQDGADFNADAVIYAIERTLDTRIECEVRNKVFGGITMTFATPDPLTLDITTNIPTPILPTMMVPLTIMSPNTPMGEVSRQPVGTGPYSFVNWVAGSEINLARFDGWWGEQPQVENVRYVWRSEPTVAAAMVAEGEADLAPNISEQDATTEMDFAYPNSETTRLRIDVDQPPLNDRRVREALNLALDRDALRGSVFPADATPATQLVLPEISGHNHDLQVWPYDPDRARQLLAEAKAAGVPVETPIRLIGRTNQFPGSAESMEAIMSMFQDVGFNPTLEMLETAQHSSYLVKPYPEPRTPLLIQDQHDNNSGDAGITVFFKYHSDGGNSVLHDANLDDVIDRAQAASGDERAGLFAEALKIINEDIIADVPLFYMVGYARVGSRINFTPTIATNSEIQLQTITFK